MFFFVNLFVGIMVMSFQTQQQQQRDGDNPAESGDGMMTKEQKAWVRAQKVLRTAKPVARKDIPSSIFRRVAWHTMRNPLFDWAVNGSIIANVLLLALEYEGMPLDYSTGLEAGNLAFTIIFAIEAGIKIAALYPRECALGGKPRVPPHLLLLSAPAGACRLDINASLRVWSLTRPFLTRRRRLQAQMECFRLHCGALQRPSPHAPTAAPLRPCPCPAATPGPQRRLFCPPEGTSLATAIESLVLSLFFPARRLRRQSWRFCPESGALQACCAFCGCCGFSSSRRSCEVRAMTLSFRFVCTALPLTLTRGISCFLFLSVHALTTDLPASPARLA